MRRSRNHRDFFNLDLAVGPVILRVGQYKMIMKLFTLLVMCLAQSGCWYCSTRVSEIGLRGDRIYGAMDGTCRVETVAIKCFNYYGINLPYSYSLNDNHGKVVGLMNGKWTESDGSLLIAYDSKSVKRSNVDKNELLNYGISVSPSRRWWGYPLQILIIPAIPIDILSLPFILVADSGNVRAPGP
jgi:hypothetical protein